MSVEFKEDLMMKEGIGVELVEREGRELLVFEV